MPSNAKLTEEIVALAEALSIEVQTEGLNNSQLAELLSELKKQKEAADTPPEGDDQPDTLPEDEEVAKPPYYVADGKAITTKKGVLDAGCEVKAQMLFGDEDALKALVKKKVVIKS